MAAASALAPLSSCRSVIFQWHRGCVAPHMVAAGCGRWVYSATPGAKCHAERMIPPTLCLVSGDPRRENDRRLRVAKCGHGRGLSRPLLLPAAPLMHNCITVQQQVEIDPDVGHHASAAERVGSAPRAISRSGSARLRVPRASPLRRG